MADLDFQSLPNITGDELHQALTARALVLQGEAEGKHVAVLYDPWAEEYVAAFAAADSLLTANLADDGHRAETMDLAIIAAAQAADITMGG